jgi:hypothetical protein
MLGMLAGDDLSEQVRTVGWELLRGALFTELTTDGGERADI